MTTPSLVLVSPRPRGSDLPASCLPKVRVCLSALEPLFDLPQESAARCLGVSLTSLKSACRKIGLRRWPYRRWPQDPEPDALPSSSDPSSSALSPARPRDRDGGNEDQEEEEAVPSPPVPEYDDDDAAMTADTTASSWSQSLCLEADPEAPADAWLAGIEELGEEERWLAWYGECELDDDTV